MKLQDLLMRWDIVLRKSENEVGSLFVIYMFV